MVRPRANGADDLVRFRGGEHKAHMRRRFFHELEQRVEALSRDHVRLVKDEHFVAIPRRRKGGAFAQVSRVVNAVVARRVNLDHIHGARPATSQLDARRTRAARSVSGALLAVEAASKNARRGCLATPTRAREQIRVRHPIGPQGLHEWHGDVVLAHNVGKRIGPVAAIQGSGHVPEPSRRR